MKSLRFLERGKSRKAMKVMKVRRKSGYSIGMTKCMRVKRTNRIHSWGSISGHVDDRCRKLIGCMRMNISNRRGRLRQRSGRLLKKRSGRGSIEGIRETEHEVVGKTFCVPKRPHAEKHEDVC